jgi:hypothetical protein
VIELLTTNQHECTRMVTNLCTTSRYFRSSAVQTHAACRGLPALPFWPYVCFHW